MYAQQHACLTKWVKYVVLPTNLYPTCQVHTALEESFSLSISTLTDIHESERSITMVDDKLSSIILHWYSIHEPHMWDSGLVLVVTGEVEVSVKTLVGSTTCSRITCSVRHDRKFMAVGFTAYMPVIRSLCTHTPMHTPYMDTCTVMATAAYSCFRISRPSCTLKITFKVLKQHSFVLRTCAIGIHVRHQHSKSA